MRIPRTTSGTYRARSHQTSRGERESSLHANNKNGSARPTSTGQQQHQLTTTILQRRDRLRVYEAGEDVTPRTLVHTIYGSLEDRRTAFDAIGQLTISRSGSVSAMGPARASLATISSASSVYTIDEVLAAAATRDVYTDTAAKRSRVSLAKGMDVVEDTEDTPSQFHLPRFDLREFKSMNDRITITLCETQTYFLFELPQLTEYATTEEGQAVSEENERYKGIMTAAARKIVDAETQTPQVYTKTRGTYIGRQDRKNHATIVNNWVMHDTYLNQSKFGAGEPHEKDRFKFSKRKTEDGIHMIGSIGHRSPEEQLAEIGSQPEYEDAARVTLRILASRRYEKAQKRFAGLIRQDPCDPELELVYGLELLWLHMVSACTNRSVNALRWSPANNSLLAVGYGSIPKKRYSEDTPVSGLVCIWSAKNPSEPDRFYSFNSPVSDLDWSKSRPNLLAVGFYDGIIRVIDISKKQLTVIRQSERQFSPSFAPHWQVQWWLVNNESLDSEHPVEQLYTSNQDGRVSFFPANEDFISREILQVQRLEGKIPGVARVNHCSSQEVPISRTSGALLLRRHPRLPDIYLVGTEEGCVHRCSTGHPHSHLESFVAHDGPIYSLEVSPFCDKLILTCGADWTARIWAEGLDEPLLTFSTSMAYVAGAAWSPRNSTIFANAVDTEICLWDVRRKTHRPASVTQVTLMGGRLTSLQFTRSGEQIVAGDDRGTVYIYGLQGMPLPAFDQRRTLIEALEKALLTKPELLRRLKKLGAPFNEVDV